MLKKNHQNVRKEQDMAQHYTDKIDLMINIYVITDWKKNISPNIK